MNIGVVAYILNPKSGARAPIEIAKGLSKNNDVTFYALSWNKHPGTIKQFKKLGIKVELFDKSGIPILGNIFDFLKLKQFLRSSNHEVLSAHTTLSLLIASVSSGIPTTNTYYGTQFNVLKERYLDKNIVIDFLNKLINVIIFIKGFLLVRLPKEVVGISAYTKSEAKKLYGRDITYIYLGNVPKHFSTSKPKSKSKVVNVLSASRITPYKRFEKIISAVKNIYNSRVNLYIVGSAPQSKYLNYLKSIKNNETKILTNVSDKKLVELYTHSDIYVTADKYLFFGMPILEAASFGKPAIAYDFCAASELIEHGKTGYVAKTDDEFEKYMKKLIDNPKLRSKMGRQAKVRSANFSWDKTAREYKKMFKKLIYA